jgi:Na+-transporting NADH:ubiquinone oxidoreductase subunit NqrB
VDPRFYQIAFLASFLGLGVLFRDFRVGWPQVFVVFFTAYVFQIAAIFKYRLPWAGLRSATISSLGLLVLIRTNSLSWLALASALMILSKFIFRFRGKHFFNPTNFSLALLLLLSDQVWISPSQWGEEFLIAAWIVMLGILVTHKALSNDISYSFLGWYLLFLFARVAYLGQPYSVFLHQLKSGSLLLFCFFMISDPKSTPNHRYGRIVFSAIVAALAYFIKFKLYNPNALVLSLFFLSPLTLLIDKVLPAKRFEWPNQLQRSEPVHETSNLFESKPFGLPYLGFLRFLRR